MNLTELSQKVFTANLKWWQDIETNEPIKRNKGELIALIHSELSEALEAVRKNLDDDKLTQYKGEHVEMADALIRILDYCGGFDIDIQKMFDLKMAYNANRADHKPENRLKENGKKF